jgi:biotin transport system substrate-specific component
VTLDELTADRRGWHSPAIAAATVLAASLLLIASARFTVPFYPVPMSMQTLVAIGLGLSLGPARAGLAVLLYLAEGAAGMPVFAGTPEKGLGLAYMMGPTGGYLVGFYFAAVIAGLLANRGWGRSPLTALAAALVAGAAVYLPGLLWLGSVIGFDKPVLELGLYPFIPGDLVKAMLAALLAPMAWKMLEAKAGR